ncbi:hypothetical protein [Synechococcus sp. PCC 7335]|uniref:hypothetical protein n=1 Tax=Synechococcus sp. (strain ATCC 29403 / PCC 7335) TaxID=91464 RepID=UPI0006814C9C|nr:hypothetical protein [Synechococcus sp. PCC 7335]
MNGVEGSSLQGISRIGKRAYGTVVDIVRTVSYKAQLVHDEAVQDVECSQITVDEMWLFVKKAHRLRSRRLDCWLGVSPADESRLILSLRVGKHTDEFLTELVASTEGKTDCKFGVQMIRVAMRGA